jgi:hypothetical protein
MAFVSNPSAQASTSGLQPTSEKNQNSGYVGIGSSGEVSMGGKIGFNGATPVGKAVTIGAAQTGASISLVEVLTIKAPINDHAAKIDAIVECLKKVGLMA